MRTKEQLVKATKATIANNLLTGALAELANQQYGDCLKAIIGKEHSTFNDGIYIVSKANIDQWTIEFRGLWSWMVRFEIKDRYDGVYEEYIAGATVCYNEYITTTLILGELVSVVADILSTYHPDGRPLEFSTQETV